MDKGVLPSPVCERCGQPFVRSLLALPLAVTVQYLLMGLALIVLCFRRPSKILISIAIAGIYSSLRGGWGVATRLEFLGTFFGLSRRGHVHYNELIVTHIVLMVALLLVSLELLDQESRTEATPTRTFPTVSPETQVIEAEIVSGHEALDFPPRNGRSLRE